MDEMSLISYIGDEGNGRVIVGQLVRWKDGVVV